MKNQSKLDACKKGKLYQVSLLQGLTYGDYHGSVTIEELCKNGDTGLGTFDRLNGELVLLDGEVYRVAGDGSVELVLTDESTPFAVATYISDDFTEELREIVNIDMLQKKLQEIVETRGRNRFYMIRID